MFQFVTDHWVDFVAVAGLLLSIAHVVVKLTPSTKDDAVEADIEKVASGFGVKPAAAPTA